MSVANWKRAFDSGAFEGSQILLVAEADDVVGFVLVGGRTADVVHDQKIVAAYEREIVSLHVAPDWQKRGVGRRLVQSAVEWLITQQQRRLAVRVLEQNPNRGFYARLGAEELGAQPYDWAGFATREIIYGWRDISLIRSTA